MRQITPKAPPLWEIRTPEEAAEHWEQTIGKEIEVEAAAPGIPPVYGSWLYRKPTPKN